MLSPFAPVPRNAHDVRTQFAEALRLAARRVASRTATPRDAVVHAARRLADLLEAADRVVELDEPDGERWSIDLVAIDPGLPSEHEAPERYSPDALHRWIALIRGPAVDEPDALSRRLVPPPPSMLGGVKGAARRRTRSAETVSLDDARARRGR